MLLRDQNYAADTGMCGGGTRDGATVAALPDTLGDRVTALAEHRSWAVAPHDDAADQRRRAPGFGMAKFHLSGDGVANSRGAVEGRAVFAHGARIQEGIDSLAGFDGFFARNTPVSGGIPHISVIVGSCANGSRGWTSWN
jgi:hypothetical protein